jgi:hypothetical protein
MRTMNLHVFLFLEPRTPVCFANILEKLRWEMVESASFALHRIFALPASSPEPRYHAHGECGEFVPPQNLPLPNDHAVRLRPARVEIDLSQFLSQILVSRIRTCSKNTSELRCPLNGSTMNQKMEICIENNRMQHMWNASIIIVLMILHRGHLNVGECGKVRFPENLLLSFMVTLRRYVFQKIFF